MNREVTENMRKWLCENVPAEGGCLLAKNKNHYYLITRFNISNGEMFTINDNFWYDYGFVFEDGGFEIIYKHEVV